MRGRILLSVLGLALLAACGRPYISPLAPPPYKERVVAPYEVTWRALIKALARENVPLRAVAKDSGVVASDDFVTPIGVYADCGRFGDLPVEGAALVTFTVFVESANSKETEVQVNTKMRTQGHRKGDSGKLKSEPVLSCASTGRWESNLIDAVRALVRE
ncbi:MAG: hypothetical protein HY724_03330 [Candidatus Rokubacteria bacterium]|nr:hypothetical protein [Candidatus Rokubacteria bacterium]